MPLDPDPRLGPLLEPDAPPPAAALGEIVRRRQHRAHRRLKAVSATAVVIALAASGVAVASLTTRRPAPAPAAAPQVALRQGGPEALSVSPPPAGAAPVAAKAAGASVHGASKGLSWSTLTARRQDFAAANEAPSPSCRGGRCAAQRSLTRVFSWTFDQVSVRAYATGASGTVARSAGGVCALTGELRLEVSDEAAVGTVVVPAPVTTGVVSAASTAVIGAAEGEAVEVVGLRVGSQVRSVTATFSSGAREVATPKSGWVALVDLPASRSVESVRVEAFGAGDTPLATVALPARQGTAVSSACLSAPRAPRG